jgi:nitrate/nitrite transport system ATP-binding protein
VLHLSRAKMFRKVIIPAMLPYIFTGWRLSLGIAWLVIVASEMLTGAPGIEGRYLVLRGIDLVVELGEFVAIVGYSGSGKTTLLSLIVGLMTPNEREILLEGVPVQGPRSDRGIAFQNDSLLPWLTVFENIYLAVGAVSPGLATHEKRLRTEQWVRLVHLEEATAKRPHELSGGM